ncbi:MULTISPECIES: hypothetical protein [unclassified Paenibacillus]|uniref:hypothetical protein n=1 Tax=unclassified Paenibacillus TaxID=185978 RepID=UPI000838F99C|nr:MULTISPECIES: hypothetical protein [unclassified Paenibacillus]NWL87990.1 hypothetical protein [Paenibacillus sp. 79R4]
MEYLALFISLIALIACLSVYNKVSALEARIKAMPFPGTQAVPTAQAEGSISYSGQDEVIRLIHEGKKIEAIKKSRALYGMSLLEAKQYVDDLTLKVLK